MEASSVSVVSTASTDATTLSRDSSSTHGGHESTVILSKSVSSGGKNAQEVRHLHSQIEDLLTALSELQREQAVLQSQLRKEQDEREADKETVRPLLEELRKKTSTDSDLTTKSEETVKPTEGAVPPTSEPMQPGETPQPTQETRAEEPAQEQPQTEQVVQLVNSTDLYAQQGYNQYGGYNQPYANPYTYNQQQYQQPYVNPYDVYNQQQPAVNPYALGGEIPAAAQETQPATEEAKTTPPPLLVGEELLRLLEAAEERFRLRAGAEGQSGITASKSQLQEDLEKAKEETAKALAQADEYSKKIYDLDHELNSTKEQLRESHAHCRTIHQDKQRLEKLIHAMRTRASTAVTEPTPAENSNRMSVVGGLREFKLGRSRSSPTQNSGAATFSKRMSSLPTGRESIMLSGAGGAPPANDQEALLLELVQAKTAEAMASQEAEEAKQRLESFRKAYGLAPGENPPPTAAQAASAAASQAAQTAGAAAQAAMGMLGRFTATVNENANKAPAASQAPATQSGANGGGFWGWRR
jgi:predicted nuclease with TOPRIM domain